MIDVLTLGEALVSFRTAGPLAGAWKAEAHVAGAEANVAIGLARLGHRSGWVGCVSDDDLGTWVTATLAAEGVDTTYVRRVRDAAAGAMVLVDPTDHARRVTYLRRGSAGSRLTSGDAIAPLDDGVRWVHLTGITPALSDSARDAWVALARAAKARRVPVCLDVNFRPALWSRQEAAEAMASVRGLVDLLVASDDEVDLVDDPGIPLTVLKRGSEGATLVTAEGELDVPAEPVPVVDVIGAGDALCAGLLSGLLDGLDPVAALHRGSWVAGRCVSSAGDWEGLPYREDVS
ncbi:MAG TPA: sugar kinase [Propionibacteriaceae bacterium]|nr:sugar kinase [Propionibacteriaceae bacterium]